MGDEVELSGLSAVIDGDVSSAKAEKSGAALPQGGYEPIL
jgi:hypothetical protein